jgi:hypothetical protein
LAIVAPLAALGAAVVSVRGVRADEADFAGKADFAGGADSAGDTDSAGGTDFASGTDFAGVTDSADFFGARADSVADGTDFAVATFPGVDLTDARGAALVAVGFATEAGASSVISAGLLALALAFDPARGGTDALSGSVFARTLSEDFPAGRVTSGATVFDVLFRAVPAVSAMGSPIYKTGARRVAVHSLRLARIRNLTVSDKHATRSNQNSGRLRRQYPQCHV